MSNYVYMPQEESSFIQRHPFASGVGLITLAGLGAAALGHAAASRSGGGRKHKKRKAVKRKKRK